MQILKPKSRLNNHILKQESLVFGVSITANATPASKVHVSDIPLVAVLKTQGKTAEADAIETYTSSPALDDATGVIDILLDDKVDKVYEARVVSIVGGTSPSATISSALTAAGRIILKIDINQTLASVSVDMVIEVKYLAKN